MTTQELQSYLQKKGSPSILTDDFSSSAHPSIFTSIAAEPLDQSNETSVVFPALKSTSHFKLSLVIAKNQIFGHT